MIQRIWVNVEARTAVSRRIFMRTFVFLMPAKYALVPIVSYGNSIKSARRTIHTISYLVSINRLTPHRRCCVSNSINVAPSAIGDSKRL